MNTCNKGANQAGQMRMLVCALLFTVPEQNQVSGDEARILKPVLSSHSKNTHQKLVFNTDYHLMQVKSIAECSKGSILQYF